VDLRIFNLLIRFKRYVVAATLLAFVACLVPWPSTSLSSGSSDRLVGSQEDEPKADPYPCEGGHCGCRTAERCWTSCCCKTPVERELWAKQRGIVPPSYAVRPKSFSEEQLLGRRQATPKVGVTTKACCKRSSSDLGYKELSCKERKPGQKVWLGIAAAKCQGGSWDFLQIVWMPTNVEAFELPFLAIAARGIEPLRIISPEAPPEPPPPKSLRS
jgi:hypothetical protein